MTDPVSPVLLYGACALGALGVAMALPRRGSNPQVVGALLAAIALGALFLALGRASGPLPNIHFYIFSAIGLGAALRVISHPRPVYAALYFVLTILSSCGLYVILSAEFMAFALIIVYAGAILITYLFVIMLATQAPTEDDVDALAAYDRYAREPAVATVAGFVLVALLTTMVIRGAAGLPDARHDAGEGLAALPRKVERILKDEGILAADESIARVSPGGPYAIETDRGRVTGVVASYGEGETQLITESDTENWPTARLSVSNVEALGFSLLGDKPGAIEIAGVILLMAMLGAVVLARKRAELDEQQQGQKEAGAA